MTGLPGLGKWVFVGPPWFASGARLGEEPMTTPAASLLGSTLHEGPARVTSETPRPVTRAAGDAKQSGACPPSSPLSPTTTLLPLMVAVPPVTVSVQNPPPSPDPLLS